MKKFLFLGLAAMMAFTSCTKDETLAVVQNGAIGFDVSADKATRAYDPSTTTATIDNFAVYGWMNEYTGVVFDNEVVTRSGSDWTYTNTQYWTPNNYYFAALSPAQSKGGKWTLDVADTQDEANLGIGQVTFPNDGKQDLLYWAGNYNYVGAQTPVQGGRVAIEFKHLLSKVQFSFANGFENENTTIRISNVKINNAETEGSIDLAVADWRTKPAWNFTNASNTQVLDFGNVVEVTARTSEFSSAAAEKIPVGKTFNSDHEMLLFPAKDKTYNVTFTAELLYGGVVAASYDHEVAVTTTLNMGYAYNFKAKINAENITGSTDSADQLKPITFTVTVKKWDQADVDVKVENITYTTIEDGVVAAGETLELKGNAIIAGTMQVAGNINGNGYTVVPTAPKVTAGTYRFIELNGADVKVENLVVDGKNMTAESNGTTYGIRGFYITGNGNYTLENVTIKNVTYTLNTGSFDEGTLKVSNSTFEGWTSIDNIKETTFTNVNFTNGAYARVRPYNTTTFVNCDFEKDFVIDLSYAENGDEVITFENCTVAGVALAETDLVKETTASGKTHTFKGTVVIK